MIKNDDGNLKKYTSKNPLKKLMLRLFEEKLAKIVRSLDLQRAKILDAGCGEGFVAELIYHNTKEAQIQGIDCRETAIRYAKENCSLPINFSIGDIYDSGYVKNEFDLVCATEVLEHLESPEKALREMDRVSKKYMLLSVPNEPWFCLGNFLSGKNVLRLGNPPDHVNHYVSGRGFKTFLQSVLPREYKIKVYTCYVWTIALVEKNGKEQS